MLTEDNLPKAASAFSSSTAFQVERASWPPLPQDCPGLSDILHRRAPSRWGGSMRDWMYCYSLLLHRSFQNCIRNPGNFFARVFCTTFVALVSGLVFYQVSVSPPSFFPSPLPFALNSPPNLLQPLMAFVPYDHEK